MTTQGIIILIVSMICAFGLGFGIGESWSEEDEKEN